MSRRSLLKGGGAALAGLSTVQVAGPAHAFPGGRDEVLVPWVDRQLFSPPPFTQIDWEQLDSWLTPNDEFFVVFHYNIPPYVPETWSLGITGLVARPQTLRLADLKTRSRREQTVTLECSGDHGFADFTGAVSNARWAGTPLAPLLERAGLERNAQRGRVLRSRRRNAHDPGQPRRAQTRRRRHAEGRPSTGHNQPHDHRAVLAQHVARGGAGPRQPAGVRDERRAAAGRPRRSRCV